MDVSLPPVLTVVLLKCLLPFFIHLKLELLTQFSASNDENYLYLREITIQKVIIFDFLIIYYNIIDFSDILKFTNVFC